MDAFVQREATVRPAAAPSKDPLEECDAQRKLDGFLFSDQLHARMPCKHDATHVPFIFRAKSGVNINKLWWKCPQCIDPKNKKPGALLGLDSELEESGKRRIEEMQDEVEQPRKAARKEIEVPAGAIVASGRGLDWAALFENVTAIRAELAETRRLLAETRELVTAEREQHDRADKGGDRQGEQHAGGEGGVPDQRGAAGDL